MEFISTQDFSSDAERVFWDAIKEAFDSEPGYCWHRYPITSMSGPRLEPDILILHPKWGLNVVEIKGCFISNVEAIDGPIWYMRNWYEDEIAPLQQAEKHMWAIIDRMKEFHNRVLREENGDCRVTHRAFVALPFITEQEWQQKFSDHIASPKWEVIFSTDLTTERLKERLTNAPVRRQKELSEEEWGTALALIRYSEGIQQKPRRPTKKTDSKAAWLRQVEQQMKAFDLQQHRVAFQVPSGPQRIRGLAGTGKTIVVAQKAAYMHVRYPEWDIVVTFYSRSLYGQITKYITQFVQQFSQGAVDEPNWEKIQVLHGWGAQNQPGFYSQLCELVDVSCRNYSNALNHFATRSGRVALDNCCKELLETGEVPQLFDAILVDEAQDFGEYYLRLCYAALKQPKRIVWAYDEIQSLEELEIPTAEKLFGYDADGKPLVDLDGVYPGEIDKDMILYHCYRNPRPVLIAAHAFGLGLKRRGGAIQFIDTVGGWQDIGYEVRGIEGGTMQTGQLATLYRPESNSPHLLEKLVGYHNLVEWHLFDERRKELEWIVNDVARNILEEELTPDEIAIIALDSRKKVADAEYKVLHDSLAQKGITSVRVGTDISIDAFRARGAVTITSVFRAKGNEASLIYVYGFEEVGNVHKDYDIVTKRNLAFTAMTRTKGWLVLTGVGQVAGDLFGEIEAILENIGSVSLVVPDMAKIQRNLETYENQRRRVRIKQVERSISKTIKDLADVNPEDLSPELKKQLYRLLFGEKPE
jgi:superfamily I DNA and RNA helicase